MILQGYLLYVLYLSITIKHFKVYKQHNILFSENDYFSHFIRRPVSSKQRSIFKNWKRFFILTLSYTITSLIFTHVLHIGIIEVIFRGKMFRFQNDCSSHQMKRIVYIKWRWILRKCVTYPNFVKLCNLFYFIFWDIMLNLILSRDWWLSRVNSYGV